MNAVEEQQQLARDTLDVYERHLAAGVDPESSRFLTLSLIDGEIEDANRDPVTA